MEKKKNIFVRFANVWYYYKFYVLIGIILIIALIVGINSCFFRESYDLSILYITSEDTDRFSHSEDVLNKIETFVSDINGDGKANAEIITISYGQTQAEQQSAQRAGRSGGLFSDQVCPLQRRHLHQPAPHRRSGRDRHRRSGAGRWPRNAQRRDLSG